MKKIDFNKNIDFLTNRIEALKGKITNEITEDARAEIEGRIAQLQEVVDDLKAIRDEAADGGEDKSEAMLAQMREVMARLDAIENNNKNEEKMENRVKRLTEKEFADIVMNSFNAKEFKAHVKDLAVKNSITITDGTIEELMPAAILNEVNDIFVGHRHRLLELVDWTGLPAFKAFFETANEMGHGWPHPQGITEGLSKPDQNLVFSEYVIRPQFIFKKISVDKEILKWSENDGSVFIRYIVRELLERLLCTIENYILNGTASFNAPIVTAPILDANSNMVYNAMQYLPYSPSDELIAIITPQKYATLKQTMQATYGYYINDEFMARDFFGVSEVVLTPPGFTVDSSVWLNGGDFFLMNRRMYKMVGDRRPDQYEDFNLSYNKVEYLMEMWVGGGCITNEFIIVGEKK